MNLYNKFVTKNSYLIVEDSSINGHPVYRDFGPGPMEAIDEFLLTNREFIIDYSREKYMLTTNPKGYLKKL
jgi:cephalosporin hydroxylase